MIPYAYKDHQLFEHLEGTADKATRYLNSLGQNVICNRFSKLGLNINNEELKEVVRLSALLHDIGKAADNYQSNLYSFNLHEIPSAVITERVLKEQKMTEEHKDLIVITVLQHMNSMRDWISVNRYVKNYGWRFTKCNNEVRSFLNKHGLRDDIDLEVTPSNAYELIHVYQNKSRSNKWLKLYNLILALITAGDNIDSYRARKDTLGPNRRWFVEELMRLEEY